MLPWQQPESSMTRIFDISSQPLQGEAHVDAHAMATNLCEGSDLHDICSDHSIAIECRLMEELLATMASSYMCTLDGLPDFLSACGGNAHADDTSSFSFLENLDQPVGQSQTLSSPGRPVSPVYPVHEASGSTPYQHKIDTCGNYLNGHLNVKPCTSSSSMDSMRTPFSPSFVSGESSGINLPNTDTSFIHPSPVYSEASTSFAMGGQHVSSHVPDHDVHLGIYGTNSSHPPISPRHSHGNACMAYSCQSMPSHIASSDGDFFDNEASSLLAFASASAQIGNLDTTAAVRTATMAHWPQQTRASPLHEECSHCVYTAGNPEDSEATKSEHSATFLVESSTPNIDDGYIWRKYGQKNIKGRIYPRSYFRCAQPNCPVKKQTESSSNERGFVLIAYFGRHNH